MIEASDVDHVVLHVNDVERSNRFSDRAPK
jgi:hypothetical protein